MVQHCVEMAKITDVSKEPVTFSFIVDILLPFQHWELHQTAK